MKGLRPFSVRNGNCALELFASKNTVWVLQETRGKHYSQNTLDPWL